MENWTFDTLKYERPDLEQAKKLLKESAAKVKAASSADEVFDVIRDVDEAAKKLATMLTVAFVRHTIDTSDKFYEQESDFFDAALPELGQYQVEYSAALSESAFRPEIEKKYGRQFFTQIDLQKKSFCEKNIPLMQEENRLASEYEKLMASCKIDFDGKELNLYGIQKYFEDDDRNVRRAAFKAYSDFYHSNEERMEEIWDSLIKVRNEQGRNLGFKNYIPLGYMRQGRVDYGQKEVASFREQVREVMVPMCEKIYEAQAKRLGLDHVMAYDEQRVFADGNAHPAGDDDAMMEAAVKMYHDMSPETGEFVDFMVEHKTFDLKNRPNKASTGYMTELPSLKSPYVFSCFNGTIGDIQVLTHEFGHAFAGYMAMRSQPISDYYSESTDIAEIHSMSMEQFAYPYAEWFFGDEADKFRFGHLQDSLTFVPFGVAVDEFQHICYENEDLSPKERTLEWKKLEEKYMPWRRYDADDFFDRGGYWYHKLHIFQHPMYYINYTLTTMGAMEFKKKAAEDRDAAWQDYLTLCKVGGSMGYLETLRAAHLSVPFEPGAVKRSVGYAFDILMNDKLL
ncbi:MAG: M3 family oligoendopeptidase [Eubacterium sp.]|jgi:M3 family oligoendopeptidase